MVASFRHCQGEELLMRRNMGQLGQGAEEVQEVQVADGEQEVRVD
jgi:hypothetical protein